MSRGEYHLLYNDTLLFYYINNSIKMAKRELLVQSKDNTVKLKSYYS